MSEPRRITNTEISLHMAGSVCYTEEKTEAFEWTIGNFD